MLTRDKTKPIFVNNLQIGGQNKVVIQSMCKIKTENVKEICKQINECASIGAELMRVSVLDEKDALAIKQIKKHVSIPICADIHFDYNLAILAIQNGADKIRINPGNISNKNQLKTIIAVAKKYNTVIRIGVNAGSLSKKYIDRNDLPIYRKMYYSARDYIKFFEKNNFTNLVVSLKASNLHDTIEAYFLASKYIKYPLHIGLTEAGIKDFALIRSSICLSELLNKKIGDTIRISISDDPKEEVMAAKRLLHDCGLYNNYPTIISCPTCGRTQADVKIITSKIVNYLEKINKNITVAIMGCVVNGPGEAKNADIGLAGGKNEYLLFKKGQIVKKIASKDAYNSLIKEIDDFIN